MTLALACFYHYEENCPYRERSKGDKQFIAWMRLSSCQSVLLAINCRISGTRSVARFDLSSRVNEPKLAASARDGSSCQTETAINLDPASVTACLISAYAKSAGAGMCKSKTTTCGLSSRIKATVCGKSSASPTTVISEWRSNTSANYFPENFSVVGDEYFHWQ